MKRDWVKLQTDFLADKSLRLIIKRYGHDCLTVFIALMTESTEGVLLEPEEVLAEYLFIDEQRFLEIIKILEKYSLVCRDSSGFICLTSWAKFQTPLDDLEKQREIERQRKAEYRAKKAAERSTSQPETRPKDVPEMSQSCPALELEEERELELEEEIHTPPIIPQIAEATPPAGVSDGLPVVYRNREVSKSVSPLFAAIRDAFQSKTPVWSKPAEQIQAIARLVELSKAIRPADPGGLMRQTMAQYWDLTQSQDRFWGRQPFTPKMLVAHWDQVQQKIKLDTGQNQPEWMEGMS